MRGEETHHNYVDNANNNNISTNRNNSNKNISTNRNNSNNNFNNNNVNTNRNNNDDTNRNNGNNNFKDNNSSSISRNKTNNTPPLRLTLEPSKQQQIATAIRKQQQQKMQQQRQQQKRPPYASDFDTSSESDPDAPNLAITDKLPINVTGIDDQIIQMARNQQPNPFTKQNKYRKRLKAKQARKEHVREQQKQALFDMCDSTHKAINNNRNNNNNNHKNSNNRKIKNRNSLRKDKNYNPKNSNTSKSTTNPNKPTTILRPGAASISEDGKKASNLNSNSMQSRLQSLQQQAKQQTGLDFKAPTVSGTTSSHRPPPAPNIIQPHQKDSHQFARMQSDFRAANFVPTVTPFLNVADVTTTQQSPAVPKGTADRQ